MAQRGAWRPPWTARSDKKPSPLATTTYAETMDADKELITNAKLRVLFPHLKESELAYVREQLRQYVELAREIFDAQAVLTHSGERATVRDGEVDPSTSKNTG